MITLLSAHLASLEDLSGIVRKAQQLLPPQAIVLLSGDLGVGKTTFVSVFCRELGIANVQSPTYAIHNRYPGIDHLDLYRLESRDQLESAGIFDIIEESKGYCFIEWPERLREGDLPASRKVFEIKLQLNEGGRSLVLRALN